MNVGALESHTWAAPSFFSTSTCSGLRTMFTRPHACPRGRSWRASARGWRRPRCARAPCGPPARMVATMPSAVSGLTKQDAPSAGRRARRQDQALHGLDAAVLRVHGAAEDGDGLAQQRLRGRATRPPGRRRLRPRCRRASTGPGAPASAFTAAGSDAGRHHGAGRPCRMPWPCSGRRRRTGAPWSEGLMGEASMRTMTSSGFGSGVGMRGERELEGAIGLHRGVELKACIRVGHESPPRVPRRNVVQSRSRLRSVSRACAARRRRVKDRPAGPAGVNPPPYRRVDADTAGD